MKTTKKFLAGAVVASTVAFTGMASVANAEISASAGVASSYLWRGQDLGQGTPAVSGDISYSAGGFYTGAWVSSGDSASGTEYDIFAGYGGEVGSFTYDLSVWNYLYPQGGQEDTVADLSEVILTLGSGPVSFSWYENIATNGGDETYRYYTLGYSAGAFGVTVGQATGDASDEYNHIDFSYAYNDSLSFKLSQVIDDADDAVDDDLIFVVSYSLPIE
ncbi:MAG: hypothetical protein ACI9Y1_000620 [Lentisphaeria bacterium]|jgi:uncharacterized protein (TIGR02001 family)